MDDQPGDHIGENPPEYVAYRLLRDIAYVEAKQMAGLLGEEKPDRAWILRTYAQCLQTIKAPHQVKEHLDAFIPRSS